MPALHATVKMFYALATACASHAVSSEPLPSDLSTCPHTGCSANDNDLVDFLQRNVELHQILKGNLSSGELSGDTTTATTTLDPTGVTLNSEGDLEIFVSAAIANSIGVVVMFFVLGFFRKRYPIMYRHNEMIGVSPTKTADTFWGWWRPTLDLSPTEATTSGDITLQPGQLGMEADWSTGLVTCLTEDGQAQSSDIAVGWKFKTINGRDYSPALVDTCIRGLSPYTARFTIPPMSKNIGLDQAMMLEFCNLCMKILAIIGVPMICIMGPMHWIFGNCAGRTDKEVACHGGSDHLSYLSFGNIENGSWLYFIHMFIVWGVVLTVQTCIYQAQRKFLHLRYDWLHTMAESRAHTILVEAIPWEYRTDEKLLTLFKQMLPKADVLTAYVVKDVDNLTAMLKARTDLQFRLKEATAIWEKAKRNDPDFWSGEKVDTFTHLEEQIAATEPQIKAERERIMEAAKDVNGGVTLSTGFITFGNRPDTEIALRLGAVSSDVTEWDLFTPPAPEDVIWADLTQNETAGRGRSVLGYALTIGLAFAYMPMVIGITNIAKHVSLCEGALSPLCPLQSLWAGLAPTMGLQVMVAFLPTFLILIFHFFFTLRAEQWGQHKLQIWYFWFQVLFVIFTTAIGQDFTGFCNTLATQPFEIFSKLANTMPYATHFYMNYLVLQWVSHAMNLTRYFPLIKFKIFTGLYDDEEAKAMAEPEDQDYYGQGGRSARWTIMMTIGIVFGTLSPLINALAFINFALCKLVYGYLFAFAEKTKTDLGGVFWVQKLEHLFWGNIIYCILMTGVLYERAYSSGSVIEATPTSPAIVGAQDNPIWALPGLACVPAGFYVYWSLLRFKSAFAWEKLSLQELMSDHKLVSRTNDVPYVQPEFREDEASKSITKTDVVIGGQNRVIGKLGLGGVMK